MDVRVEYREWVYIITEKKRRSIETIKELSERFVPKKQFMREKNWNKIQILQNGQYRFAAASVM